VAEEPYPRLGSLTDKVRDHTQLDTFTR